MLADFGPGAKRALVIATGSEVPLALAARDALAAEGIAVRVVSMPSTERLRPPGRRLARERAAARHARASPSRRASPAAGTSTSARRTIRTRAVVGIDTFGESAPAGALFKHFGFTAEHVAAAVRRVVGAT